MEKLLTALEPYASFRFTLGLVLTGLTIYLTVSSAISLRQFLAFLKDLDRQAKGQRLLDNARLALDPAIDLTRQPALKARPGHIIKTAVFLACLRLMSWRTLARHWRQWLTLAALTGASLPMYWYVFRFGGV